MKSIKLLAFDLFGTVFDVSLAKREDLENYARQIRHQQETGEWSPFDLPAGWQCLQLHDDSYVALHKLRYDHHFRCVTFSNAPAWLTLRMGGHRDLFDAITPLECFKIGKPSLAAYPNLSLWGYPLDECAMVTSNEHFGDLEGAAACGIHPIFIDRKNGETLHDVARKVKEAEATMNKGDQQ